MRERPHVIRIRASLTEEEWKRIRIQAIERDITAEDYVAELIRKGLRNH